MLPSLSLTPNRPVPIRAAWPDPAAQANPTTNPAITLESNPRGRALSLDIGTRRRDSASSEVSVNSELHQAAAGVPIGLRDRVCRICVRGSLALLGGGITGAAFGVLVAMALHDFDTRDEAAWNTALKAGVPLGLIASAFFYCSQRDA